jgi:hypothetical protein
MCDIIALMKDNEFQFDQVHSVVEFAAIDNLLRLAVYKQKWPTRLMDWPALVIKFCDI